MRRFSPHSVLLPLLRQPHTLCVTSREELLPCRPPGLGSAIRLRVRWRLWAGALGQLLLHIFWLQPWLLWTVAGWPRQVAPDTLQQMFPLREAGADTHLIIHTRLCACDSLACQNRHKCLVFILSAEITNAAPADKGNEVPDEKSLRDPLRCWLRVRVLTFWSWTRGWFWTEPGLSSWSQL